MAELAQHGVVNCSAKTFMHGKVVATLALGTRRLYQWMVSSRAGMGACCAVLWWSHALLLSPAPCCPRMPPLSTARPVVLQDDNPMLSMHPTDFTNDPQVIARNARMAAVNAALAVDLTGQVRLGRWLQPERWLASRHALAALDLQWLVWIGQGS